MNKLVEPEIRESFTLNCRNAWHYMFSTILGELHVVQHEAPVEKNIVDDYLGWSNGKAEKAFQKTMSRMIHSKA